MAERELRRMQFLIVCLVRGLMAKKVAVRPRIKETLIALMRPFADGERERTVRVLRLDRADNTDKPVIVKVRVFPALQDKGAKPEPVAFHATEQYVLLREPIALCLRIATLQTAVMTVVLTVTRKFDETPREHLVSVNLFSEPHCSLGCLLPECLRLGPD